MMASCETLNAVEALPTSGSVFKENCSATIVRLVLCIAIRKSVANFPSNRCN
jgi:hypothetical protein